MAAVAVVTESKQIYYLKCVNLNVNHRKSCVIGKPLKRKNHSNRVKDNLLLSGFSLYKDVFRN